MFPKQGFFQLYFHLQDEFDEYGIDWDGPLPCEADIDVESVVVPVTNTPLSQEEYHQLSLRINPQRESNSYGIDIYLEVKEFVRSRIGRQ